MDEIRIGVIGSGFMGRTNAETITRYLNGAKLAAVAGGTRAVALAREYGIEADTDVPALLARRDVDAVFISTPHAQHAEQAVAAAQSGKHILLDKPMAASVADCDRVIAAAANAGVNVMIMFGQRFRKVNTEAYPADSGWRYRQGAADPRLCPEFRRLGLIACLATPAGEPGYVCLATGSTTLIRCAG